MDRIRAMLPEPQPLLVVISGFSGVGKDTVIRRMKELGYPFYFVVTATTRPRRPNEVDGVDYYFLSEAEFLQKLERDEFLEHAVVYGQHKGILKEKVRQALASGQDVIMRLDVQGAATIRQMAPEALLIFVSTASERELIRRLQGRQTESPEALAKRMAMIAEEAKQLPLFDYVVINADGHLDETVAQIRAIVSAEKCRVKPRVIHIY